MVAIVALGTSHMHPLLKGPFAANKVAQCHRRSRETTWTPEPIMAWNSKKGGATVLMDGWIRNMDTPHAIAKYPPAVELSTRLGRCRDFTQHRELAIGYVCYWLCTVPIRLAAGADCLIAGHIHLTESYSWLYPDEGLVIGYTSGDMRC